MTGYAERGGDPRQRDAAREHMQLRDGLTDRLGLRIRIIHPAGREDHQELLTPIAAGHVLRSSMALEYVSNVPQHFISGVVPVRVVERLEMVHVEHDQAHR